MTLAPVFRSKDGITLLRERGVLERMTADLEGQRRAWREVVAVLPRVLGPAYRHDPAPQPSNDNLEFLQDHFFLILFRSVFGTLGAGPRLDFYTRLNITIKGIITAADNLFDKERKELIPLKLGSGATFAGIMQLLVYERLVRALGDDAAKAGHIDGAKFEAMNRDLLDRLASIGTLEGEEEGGIDGVPSVGSMIDRVHRVRGGALFSLAFCAPRAFEPAASQPRWAAAEAAIARLGTAFQIVDDLTDFEFDLFRRSNNLLVSQIVHHGTTAERTELNALRARIADGGPDWEAQRLQWQGSTKDVVGDYFGASALEVLRHARTEARAAFDALAQLGFWFDPNDSDEVVHAIVGMEGVHRMEKIVEADRATGRV